MLTLESLVAASRNQISSDLAGEVVMLNLENGTYYGLDAVGARIWGLIQQPQPVRQVRDALLAEYEVEPARCEQDLLALLADLERHGLVEVRDAAAA